MAGSKFAVCVHVYYLSVWQDIYKRLAALGDLMDVYITCRPEICEELKATFADESQPIKVVVLEDAGMDVLPFLKACKSERLDQYVAVLKLHTKNQKSKSGAHQGKMMLEGLCGSPALVHSIMDLFQQDHDAGMVGAAFQYRSARALMYGNGALVSRILDRLDIHLDDWPFLVGTMFWISGRLLRPLIENLDSIIACGENDNAPVRTGGDGTTAHAMERVFGALPAAAKMDLYATERMSVKQDDYAVVSLRSHAAASHHTTLWLGSQDILGRHKDLQACHDRILRSNYFDREYYCARYPRHVIEGMDPIVHFILYGDCLGLDPSEEFCTNYYLLARRDVERSGMCSLHHFLAYGCREGMTTKPSSSDWIALAKRVGLFSDQWYESEYPDVGYLGVSAVEHYESVGRILDRATSDHFKPAEIPSIGSRITDGASESGLEFYLKNLLREELQSYDLIKRATMNGDYFLTDYLPTYFRTKFGYTGALREALGTSHVLRYEWESALREWSDFWNGIKPGESCRSGRSIVVFDRSSSGDRHLYDVLSPSNQKSCETLLDRPVRPSICVFTTLFGGIDDLIPVINPVPGVDYICFTDRDREDCGWRQVIVDPAMNSENLNAKIIKVLPHNYLHEYEYSMFVDANTFLIGKVSELIDICLASGDFVMWRHPVRKDVYLEACAIISHRRHEPSAILRQIQHYHEAGLPRDTGLYEASFIWRRHGTEHVMRFMERWWAEIVAHSSRDQLSLAYLVWREKYKPKVLPDNLGTSRSNDYFEKIPHKNREDELHEKGTPKVRATNKMEIAFLYAPSYQFTGSTILRSQQLSEAVRRFYEGDRSVSYTDSLEVSDSIVVLSKGFLKVHTQEVIRSLSKKNILVADFVDDPVNVELLDDIDVIMASSLAGYKDYLTRYGNKFIAHVTHHVDTRIDFSRSCKPGEFRAGYFGELVNTIRGKHIEELVSFNLVDTSKQSLEWMDNLCRFNFHYAVRERRGIDGAKPFLKGFVAAHCGANMLIQKNAGDARYYLGNDYPFLVSDDLDELRIVEELRRARDLFGSKEWEYGLEIMEDVRNRSSLQRVLEEFAGMIQKI
ncbi:rhamnan synthesis F family protein [Luteimonas saliphila]|uniref:rhamnan synthesis F family protein n=1 Tax=Luteimonas saliphila TaxID=2804919 RepID=UPI00192DA98D|nr:rhamnan synthesis F family protein [Luteimonas saliphila]